MSPEDPYKDWVCLNINIIEERKLEVLKMINFVLDQNHFKTNQAIESFEDLSNWDTFYITNLNEKQRIDFQKTATGLSIQIVNID